MTRADSWRAIRYLQRLAMTERRINRRDLLKVAGAAGASVAISSIPTACSGQSPAPPRAAAPVANRVPQQLETVRVGIIGYGNRGDILTWILWNLDGVKSRLSTIRVRLPWTRLS